MNPYQRKNNCEIEKNYAEHRKYASDILKHVIKSHGFQLDPHEHEDLLQIGLINLLECYRKFDKEHGATFKSFSYPRISGSYIDWFRKNSSIPRRQQKIYAQYRELEYECSNSGEEFSLTFAAEKLGIETEKLSAMLLRWQSRNEVHLDDDTNTLSIPNGFTDDPEAIIMSDNATENVKDAVLELEKRDQIILDLYFNKELSLKLIAEKLNLTEGRVSQIKNTAIQNLRAKLRQ
ncbi:RNA polymerase sigma factor for flagellar operon [Vibrio chagasii]|nr:RNA polymerase sigma factor for flagellar operon [Vibrio chagasii]